MPSPQTAPAAPALVGVAGVTSAAPAALGGEAGAALTITVLGIPAGQGAVRFGKHGRGYHANGKALNAWRDKVTTAARIAIGSTIAHPDGPVALHVVITVAALKKPRPWPCTSYTADADHYLRAIGDALSGVAYTDDSQICDARIQVVYPGPLGLDQPGAQIRIWSLEAPWPSTT